jgi:hypothetical protein
MPQREVFLLTRVALDDHLVTASLKLGGHKTKREAVTAALAAYVKARRRLDILDMFGKVAFRPKWNYKAFRRGRTR